MRFAEYRKAIKFKIRFKAVAEEVQPTILCRICELFAVLRAFMLESELVLEVMHHFAPGRIGLRAFVRSSPR